MVLSLLCVQMVTAQTVSGTVTDGETGTPIPGANVIQKGTSSRVSTDFDGNYTIEVSDAGGILQLGTFLTIFLII